MKVCVQCKKEKDLSSFQEIKYQRKDGQPSVCLRKLCNLCRSKNVNVVAMKRLYGITPEEKLEIIKKQKGLCAICKKKLKSGHLTHIDHDHKSGKVRGILCHLCNTSLGHFGDDVEGLMKVIKYLVVPIV